MTKVKEWCKEYDIDTHKSLFVDNIFGKFRILFLLYRCIRNKNSIMKDEFIHVNTSIDIFSAYLYKLEYKFTEND